MAIKIQKNPIEILLVEDNPGDVRLTVEAIKELKLLINLSIVEDGEKALDYLYKRKNYENVKSPNLILLDLNMPRKDGREVLAEVKANSVLGSIPIIVLTTSTAYDDIFNSYALQANCYITKPVEMGKFMEVINCIGIFWGDIVKLPPSHNN